jgi:Xaa-Pro aminopeptidase
MTTRKHRLIEIDWPEFGTCDPPPPQPLTEFESRIDAARMAMASRQLSHLIIYGDREHFANLAYLTGFDPRFEEALLVIAVKGNPLLIVGNECQGYLPASPLYVAGKLAHERFQPFSLLNQPRNDSRLLREILADEGINERSQIGCVGWKYFGADEHPTGVHAIDLPSYIVDTLRNLAGYENVANATDLLMHPGYGLRATCSASEIAYFEFTNVLASEGIKRLFFGLREGMTDFEAARLFGYPGLPLGCHITMLTGDTRDRGLTSPVGATIRRGEPLATNLCYWGSNICRAGWVAESATDLPNDAQDYVASFAGPYFEVMSEWFDTLRIGTPGGKLARLINEKLPFDRFGIFLNAGHLIHLDEWLSSPIYPESQLPLRSGMAIQVDVIPDSPTYFSTRMEDGIVLADRTLRQELAKTFPDCYARCQQRRAFMSEILGIALPEEVLPLSNIPAIVPPFFLNPNLILAL